jgi:hypothetical protein
MQSLILSLLLTNCATSLRLNYHDNQNLNQLSDDYDYDSHHEEDPEVCKSF